MIVKSITDSSFEEVVLKSKKPVLLDFWAEWCAPCKQIAPVLEEIANERKDYVEIKKINIEENTEIPSRYGVRGIPTLMIFKEGELADTKVGSMEKSLLLDWLDSIIK